MGDKGSAYLDERCLRLLRATFFSPERVKRHIAKNHKIFERLEGGGCALEQATLDAERIRYDETIAEFTQHRRLLQASPSMREKSRSRWRSWRPRRKSM